MNNHDFPPKHCSWVAPNWCPNHPTPPAPIPPKPEPMPGVFTKIKQGVEGACPAIAVIPSIELPTVDGLKQLYNCLVHVDANNTTYYVDDQHRIILIWAGPLETDDYDYAENPLKLRSQEVWDFKNNRVIRFNKTGEYRLSALTEGV